MGIRENIEMVQHRIAAAAVRAGRDPKSVMLIAVSKTKPVSMIQEALSAGQEVFGENRVQELCEKYEVLPDAQWHLIGHLQTNKVKAVVGKAALIHSVDSAALADEIEKRAAAMDVVQRILVQVNVSGEESKFGISPEALPGLCEHISALSHVKLEGLMTISVKGMAPSGNRAVFGRLRQLSEEIAALKLPNVTMQELSMGMTHDFEEAVEAGATMLRIGTAIFGARSYQE